MTRRTLDPEKLVKIHIHNNLLAYYSETCLSIFVPKRQRIFVPLSHFDVRVIHSRSDGTHKIANIYGSRDALPIPLYIISGQEHCSVRRLAKPYNLIDLHDESSFDVKRVFAIQANGLYK